MHSHILLADTQLHQLLSSISFSQYLNPLNIEEAKKAFLDGENNPPFRYQPFTKADDFLYRLDAIRPRSSHPFSRLFDQKIELVKLLIIALRDRNTKAFDDLAQAQNWYPQSDQWKLLFPVSQPAQLEMTKTAHDLRVYLQQALQERQQYDWVVSLDSCMSARVLVQSAQKKIYIQRNALFSSNDLPRLVVHEIDVHAQRSINGEKQTLKIFQTGLPHSMSTEEGLAMIAEERTGLMNPNTLQTQTQLLWAINKSRSAGFRVLYEQLKLRVGPRLSWIICLRVKRGLANPGLPGVYAKDSIYLIGWLRLKQWLENGGDIRHLYVGGVDIAHPIKDWLDGNLIRLQTVPSFWMNTAQNYNIS